MDNKLKLINDLGKSICDVTVGKLDIENDDEEFGALLCLTYLQRKFLGRIIQIEKQGTLH